VQCAEVCCLRHVLACTPPPRWQVEEEAQHCKAALDTLKRRARNHSAAALQAFATSCMFRLLDAFIREGNAFAPIVYKQLIFALIDAQSHTPLRALLVTHLCAALSAHPALPVAVLVEPLVKQVELQGINAGAEMLLFKELAHHPQLSTMHQAALANPLVSLCLSWTELCTLHKWLLRCLLETI